MSFFFQTVPVPRPFFFYLLPVTLITHIHFTLWHVTEKGCHGNSSFLICAWIKPVTCSFPVCDIDGTGTYSNEKLICGGSQVWQIMQNLLRLPIPFTFFVSFGQIVLNSKIQPAYVALLDVQPANGFLLVILISGRVQSDPHMKRYNKSEVAREKRSANITLLSLSLSLWLVISPRPPCCFSPVFSLWCVRCPTFSQTAFSQPATQQDVFAS